MNDVVVDSSVLCCCKTGDAHDNTPAASPAFAQLRAPFGSLLSPACERRLGLRLGSPLARRQRAYHIGFSWL